MFVFRFSAKGLLNLDRGGASDPFLRLAKLTTKASGKWSDGKNLTLGKEVGKTIHKTPVVMNDLDPNFEGFRVDATCCNGDLKRPLHLSVYDWDKDGTHDLIGQVKASFTDLATAADAGKAIKITNPRSTAQTGTLICHEARISDEAEQQLMILMAEICLAFSVSFSELKAFDAALKWAKDGLVSLLQGGSLPSDVAIPHPRAIEALCALPPRKVLLLIVAYESIGAAQQSIGRPADDAYDTSEALEEQLLALEARHSQNADRLLSCTDDVNAVDIFEAVNVVAVQSGMQMKVSVQQDLQNLRDRYCASPQNSGGSSRLGRLAPGTRGGS